MVPWALYRSGGDADLLRRQYPSMRAWVEQVAELAGPDHLWNTGLQLGDWLDPSAPPDQPAKARTDAMLVATAYHFRSTAILGSIAEVLGEDEDRLRYGDLARSIASAFRSEYVSPSGRLVSDAPTAYALAIVFGLLEPAMHEHAGRRLVELVRADDHRIGTGFVGTPIICDALCAVGAADTAYHLLTQRECPSWLYPVTMGATTIWERWDSILPDGSINPGDMTSFNHYALGAVADWLHRTVAGLAPTEPGYRSMIVAPRPGGGLTWARAAHDTPYGRAEVAWERTGSALRVTVTVPPNTSAEIRLPDSDQSTVVRSGTHVFSAPVRPADEDPPMPLWDPFAAMTGG
jgi:alpha-L-rhamnosidase